MMHPAIQSLECIVLGGAFSTNHVDNIKGDLVLDASHAESIPSHDKLRIIEGLVMVTHRLKEDLEAPQRLSFLGKHHLENRC